MEHTVKTFAGGTRLTVRFCPLGADRDGQPDEIGATVAASSDATLTLFTDDKVAVRPGTPVLADIDGLTLTTVVLRALSAHAGTMMVLGNVSPDERRRFSRLATRAEVAVQSVHGGPTYHGTGRNLSAAGLMASELRDGDGDGAALDGGADGRYFVAARGEDVGEILAVASVVAADGATSLRFEAISELDRRAVLDAIIRAGADEAIDDNGEDRATI